MKNVKKVIAVFLTVLLFAGMFTGCSNQGNTAEPAGGDTQGGSEENAEIIKIAYIGPLTGNNTLYGQTQQNAIQLAVEEINAQGGINGAKVVVEWHDDKSDPKETVVLAGKVCDDDDVISVFGPFSSTSAMAAAQTFIDAKMPVCSASVSHPDWSNLGEGYFFRGDSTQEQMMEAYSNFMYNDLGVRKIAAYYVQSDWGIAVYEQLERFFTALGGEIVYADLFPLETKDFSAPLAKFKDKDFELFFLASMITEGSLIVNQMRKLGIDQPLLTNNSLMMKEYLDIVGDNAEGQMLLSYFADEGNTEKFEKFRAAYESKYPGKSVDTHAFNTYDLISVMFEALRHSGNDREKFVAEMHKIKDFQGLQTKISILENGDMEKPFTPIVVKDGKWTVWEK
ncbi:MAG: ABC transporter substrate-binding protein [Tepidanaerobacteraceae bacterium]|jgi:branched-chain amino acid transport system substrate-binding protein|nr:ABC transporter substrate-binding protein [Thermoanaerobacterales bacterium]